MKKYLFGSLGMAAALLVGCGTVERTSMFHGTQMRELPSAVQTTIQQYAGDAQILDIDMERRSGETEYEITFQPSGSETKQKLHIAADGTLLSQRQAGAQGVWNEVKEAAGAAKEEVEDEAREAKDEADDAASELKSEIKDATDTRIDADVDTRQTATGEKKSAEFTAKTPSGAGVSAEAELKPGKASLDVDTSSSAEFKADTSLDNEAAGAQTSSGPRIGTKLHELPAAVRTTIQKEHANAEIADIDKRDRNGKVYYEISFKQSGRNSKIFVSEDGKLMSQSELQDRAGAEVSAEYPGGVAADTIHAKKEVRGGAEDLLKAPASNLFNKSDAESAANEAESELESAGSELKSDLDRAGAELKSEVKSAEAEIKEEAAGAEAKLKATATEVKLNTLPETVQTSIRDRAGSAKPMKIEKKIKDGKVSYDVQFQDSSKNFCVSETGEIHDKKDKKY